MRQHPKTNNKKPKIVCVCGETATGKTRIAVRLAEAFGGEIVNADSMQVYRGMDIGTAKPTAQEKARVPFHCIDVADPRETYSAGKFRADAESAIAGILSRGRLPVIAGGTGLYLKVLTRGMIDSPPIDRDFREAMKKLESESPGFLHLRLKDVDPRKAEEIPPRDALRLIRALEVYETTGTPLGEMQHEHGFESAPYNVLKIGLKMPHESLSRLIRKRVEAMIKADFAQEVRALLDLGLTPDTPSMAAVGYREMMACLRGEITLKQAKDEIVASTLRLAKSQRTWFRADKEIRWFTLPDDEEKIIETVSGWLNT